MKDVTWIEFVQRLKNTGMPLEKILEYAILRKNGAETLLARQELLLEHSRNIRKHITEQQQHLKKLNEKISLYQSALEGEIPLD